MLLLIFSSCYKYTEFDYDYSQYNRVVGAEGGLITFYANYGDDTAMFFTDSSSILVDLDVPAGALDTNIVFNFYQYQSYDVADNLSKGLAEVGSKFFYFVPIYASDGYHEHDDADLTYHISLDFNEPISVTYHYREDLPQNTIDEKKLKFEYYDWFNKFYKLYRIKIPEIDQWGEDRNIFVQWNQQGYPIGYNENDIKDIIQGYWYPFSPYNITVSNIVNWEEVEDFEVDEESGTVVFDIENTDYMYVLSRVIEIPISNIPYKARNFIENNFSVEIIHAAIVDNMLQIVFDDGTVAYFNRAGDFKSAEKYNEPRGNIPTEILGHILSNYPGDNMQGNVVEYYPDYTIYRINLTSSKTLLYLDDNIEITFLGSLVYDFDFNSLSQGIIDYVKSNYPDAKINNVTNSNMLDESEITIYLTYDGKHIKLYFDTSGEINYGIYYGLKIDDITDEVADYLSLNFPNVDIASISKTVNNDSNYYYIELINDAQIQIKEEGELMTVSTYILTQDLPAEAQTVLSQTFHSTNILTCYYLYNYGVELYGVEYAERLYVEILPNGKIMYAGGSSFLDLPENIRTYIIDNYSQAQFNNFDYYESDYLGSPQFYWFVYQKDGAELVFDEDGNFIPNSKNIPKNKHVKLWDRKPKNQTL